MSSDHVRGISLGSSRLSPCGIRACPSFRCSTDRGRRSRTPWPTPESRLEPCRPRRSRSPGSAPDLPVENQGDVRVLFLEGEELVAANLLIPPTRIGELAALKSFTAVKAFGHSLGIVPGIVVGRLRHDGIIEFNQVNGLKSWLRWATKHPT